MNCATTSQEDKGFNSKLVRLEEIRASEEWQICAFQFQTGSIRRALTILVYDTTWRRFNSKLVRLEVIMTKAGIREIIVVSIPNWFD